EQLIKKDVKHKDKFAKKSECVRAAAAAFTGGDKS
nr:RecName: Full=Scolopendra 5848.48 Da toxin [Scolopendra viridicornis nigra]